MDKVLKAAIKLSQANSREILVYVQAAESDEIRELLYKAYKLACKEEFRAALRVSYAGNPSSEFKSKEAND